MILAVNAQGTGSVLGYFSKVLPLLLASCLLALASACSEHRTAALLTVTGATMGTWYTVKYQPPESQSENYSQDYISAQIAARLQRVDALMSTYKKDSEVSRFNLAPPQQWFSVSPQTFDVILLAQQISAQTQGAFDISVASLVNLWGFGPTYQPQVMPAADQINDIRQRVGFSHLELDEVNKALRKNTALTIDLSAIAKGYGVDQVADFLDSVGVNSYMVEVGGEIRARGLKPNAEPWRIAIESPQAAQHEVREEVQRIIEISDLAVATSGDYRNYFEQDGQRYSHTIDPKTGYPVTHNLVSVTVLNKSAARADALATAFSVMGAEQALLLAAAENIAAYFIVKQGSGFAELASTAFESTLFEPTQEGDTQ